MKDPLARAYLLISQSRYDLAEQAVREVLAVTPDAADARVLLAFALLGQKRYEEAEAESRQSVRLAPAHPRSHFSLAAVLAGRNDMKRAEAAVGEAIRLDPEDVDYFGLLGRIHLARQRWSDALDAAERGLSLYAENVDCLNVRALALTQLGRKEEAFRSTDAALAKEPENAEVHLMRGWSHLHDGNYEKALEHFRETLRLDPTMDAARSGIVEALKARNILYRPVLGYFLWMSKLGKRAGWIFIIGLFILARLLRSVAQSKPELAPYVNPLLVLYLLLVMMTWTAVPLFNLVLRLNRYGRLALQREQILASNLVGGCVGAFLLFLGLAVATASPVLGLLAASAFLMIIPSAAIFNCSVGWPRTVMAVGAAVMAVCGVVGAIALPLGRELAEGSASRDWLLTGGGICGAFFLLCAYLAPWIGTALSAVEVRR